jgi:hypothetical protein
MARLTEIHRQHGADFTIDSRRSPAPSAIAGGWPTQLGGEEVAGRG